MSRISDKELLQDIQRVKDELNDIPTIQKYDERGTYSSSTVIKRFNRWTNALKKAGYSPSSFQISDRELLGDIRQVSEIVGDTPTMSDYKEHGEYDESTAMDRFGSWNSAVSEAGFEPNTKPTDQDLLNDIQRVVEIIGEAPSQSEYNDYGNYSASYIERRFDSWNDAISEAGYEPYTRNEFIPIEDLLADLEQVASLLDNPPSMEDYNELGNYSANTIRRRADGWNNALQQMDLDINKRHSIPDEELLAELSRVTEKLDKPPSIKEFKQNGDFDPSTLIKRFGEWRTAILAAGHEPAHRQCNRASKKELIANLRQVANDLGYTPRKIEYHNHPNAKFHSDTQTNHFGTWEEAIEATGMEPMRSEPPVATGKKIAKEDLILSLRQLANTLGHTPSSTDYEQYGKHNINTILRRFDSYDDALEQADLPPTDYHIADDKLISDIQSVADRLGRSPKLSEYEEYGDYSGSTVSNRYGTWNQALRNAGIDPIHQGKIEEPAQILQDIKRVSKDGVAPLKIEYENQGRFSSGTAVDHFGSFWRAAVCARCKPAYKCPLTPAAFNHYYNTTTDMNITRRLAPLLFLFTGLPPTLVREFDSTWLQDRRRECIVRIPSEQVGGQKPWIFRIPSESPNPHTGNPINTHLPEIIEWASTIHRNSNEVIKSIYKNCERIATEMNTSRRHGETRYVGVDEEIPIIRPDDLWMTHGINLARRDVDREVIERRLGLNVLNRSVEVDDLYLWIYQFEDITINGYHPPDGTLSR